MVTYPNDWDESKLLDHVSLVQGLTYTPENVKPNGTLVLRASNVQNGRLSLDDNVYVNVHVPEEKIVAKGDILVCVRNGSSALIGKSCVLPELKCTTFGAFMSVLRGDATGYFAKLFESNIVQEQVRGRSNATINQITKKDFQSILVTVPDKSEQEKIARTLSQFDTYIDDLAELIEKKKGIRDGALKDLISGSTRIFPFNEELVGRKLGKIACVQDGTHGTFKRTTTGFYLLSAKNVLNNQLNIGDDESRVPEEDYKKIVANGYPQKGDILLSCVGTIGRCCILKEENVAFQRSVAFIRTSINKKYLLYVLQSNTVQEQLKSMVNASAQGGIYLGALRKVDLKITLDDQEQEAIAAVLTAMDEEIRNLETEREKMIQIREGVMDDLLTGRIRLTN